METTFLKGLVARLTSRKFLLTIGGVLAAILLELTPEQLTAVATLIALFVGAEGAKDFREASNKQN